MLDACNFFGIRQVDLPLAIKNLIEEMNKAGVEKSVVLGQDVHNARNPAFRNYTIPNDQLRKMLRNFEDRLIPFAGVDPNSGEIALRELRHALKDLEFKGLKIHSSVNEVYPDDPRVNLLCELCQEFEVPVMFHTGTTALGSCDIKYSKPEYLDDVANDFPDLKIILAHFGWPWYEVAIAVALRHKNVFLDISGWKPRYLPETLIRYINGPLKEKVLFGTDYPMIRQTEWMQDFRSVSRKFKPQVVEKLLESNAKKLLKL